jgi:Raf kinase inhibitor-like YbhB/YbcL family protein
MAFLLQSSAFAPGASIPARYTCDGLNISPPLQWSGAPAGTQSFVLIVDDPDAPNPSAPKRTWVHWVVYDIPADLTGFPEGETPAGAKCGTNDWQRADYGGPCPPVGRHRYFHKLYALDRLIANFRSPTKAEILRAMEDHVLGEAVLIGTYQKSGQKSGRLVAR